MSPPPFEAFFIPADAGRAGQRFALYHPPQGAPKGSVLHLHAFAEEMNKSRRMVALQARAMAQAGYAVLLIDLAGCGDSSGDFGDATWADWVADALLGARWLRQRHPDAPLWLWGLRAGALLACAAASSLAAAGDSANHLLFWQPPASGKQVLQQFLRLKTARDMLGGEAAKGNGPSPRDELAQGRAVDIAGYRLNPALASGLEAATLAPPPATGNAVWFELGSRDQPLLATVSAADKWRAAGWPLRLDGLAASSFWQTTEIETAPELISATLAALSECASEVVLS